VAEDDVTDEIKTALGKATSVPDVHGNSDNVRCVISAAGVMEASNLVFVAEQGGDFQTNWTAVDGSVQLVHVLNGVMGAKGADSDTSDPGPCSVFADNWPRTLAIEEIVLVDVFNLYKTAYSESCRDTNSSDLYLMDSVEPHMGKKVGGLDNGDIEWETYTKVVADKPYTLHLYYTVHDFSGENNITLSNKTDPAPCKVCGKCTGAGLVQEKDVEERSWSVEEAKERLAELKLQREQLVNTEQPVDRELIEAAIVLGRKRLAKARHGTTGNIKSQ